MSEVYFLPQKNVSVTGSFAELLERIDSPSKMKHTEMLAVKLHPGEEGNTSFVRPEQINAVLQALRPGTGRIFLTDTTVLYPGRRMNAPDYLRLALEHGFGLPHTPPFIVADGLHGEDEVPVDLPAGFETQSAHVASMIASADAMVVISHFKGHLLTGFGGAIKNLGMGCASRAGKLYQHSSVKPVIKTDKCISCGLCASYCSFGAITVPDRAVLDANRCTGCGECLGRCPEGAIRVSWNQDMDTFMRRMVEYAWAAVEVSRPLLYVNFVNRVVPDCDCMHDTGPAFVPDIGILASTDPVAVDSASLDMVTASPAAAGSGMSAGAGDDKFRAFRPDIDGRMQLELAQSLGLGSTDYKLVKVSC